MTIENPIFKLLVPKPDINLIKNFINSGEDINLRDNNGNTILSHSCYLGYFEIVKLLLKNGANTNTCDKNKESPLCLATYRNHQRIVKLLLKHSSLTINQQNDNKGTPLMIATANSNFNLVKIFVDNKENLDLVNSENCSALYMSLKNQYYDSFFYLINNGANPNISNNQGNYPLHKAIGLDKSLDIITSLIEHGADINSINNNRNTPLHLAVLLKDLVSIKTLLSFKPDIHIKTITGTSAYSLAQESKNKYIIELFNSYEIYENYKDLESSITPNLVSDNLKSSKKNKV